MYIPGSFQSVLFVLLNRAQGRLHCVCFHMSGKSAGADDRSRAEQSFEGEHKVEVPWTGREPADQASKG